MKVRSLTDIGVLRKENQDNYWSALLNVNGSEAGVICLCDGMGGLFNGGMASRIVVEAVRKYVLSEFVFDGLKNVIISANKEIFHMSDGKQNKAMGTTCTVLVCYKGSYKIYHVGDSRAYLIRKDCANLVTTDHSAVKEYNITKDSNAALWNKYKNKLTRCIGVKDDVVLDFYEGDYRAGDVFFVCSDGCWHYFEDTPLSNDKIGNLEVLFKNCIDAGETDNITAGVLYV